MIASPSRIPAEAYVAGLAAVGLLATSWLAFGPLGLGPVRVSVIVVFALLLTLAINWRLAVYMILAIVLVEGAIANALFPSAYPLLIKDAFVLAAYVGFFGSVLVSRERLALPRSVVLPFVALTALVVLGSFNPAGDGPLVSLVGARVLLLYIPLSALGWYLARSPGSLERLVRFVLITSVPVIMFGIYQYYVGPDVVAGLGPGFARTIWIVGPEAFAEPTYRPSSTFGFVGQFGSFLFFIAILCLGSLHASKGVRERLALGALLILALTAVVLQSQRTVWVLLPVALVLLYLLNAAELRRRVGLVMVVLVALSIAVTVGETVLENRLPAVLSVEGYTSRLAPLVASFESGPSGWSALVGYGTGTALGAARHVPGGVVPEAFEAGWYQPFHMFGLLGLLIYFWLYAGVLRAAWRGFRASGPSVRWIASALFVYAALTLIVSGHTNYPPQNIYVWLFAGTVAGLARTASGSAGGLASEK